MNEEWRSVLPDFDVSNLGRVRSKKTGRISYGSNVKGYKNIQTLSGKMYVHRLVGLCFLHREKDSDVINHKNGIKTDNRVENLEWISQYENIQHSKHLPGYQANLKNRYPLHETLEILKLHFVYGLLTHEIAPLYKRSYFSIRKVLTQLHHLPQAISL